MQQSDTGSTYYQYYQSHLQNPNPNPNPSPMDASFASAPPVSSSYSPSDYSSYYSSSNSSTYPPYPQYADHANNYPPNLNSQPSNPSPQPYNFPHLDSQPPPYYPHDQNQAGVSYDHTNPSFYSNQNSSGVSDSYSSPSNYDNLYGGNSNYGVYADVGKQKTEIGSRHDYEMDGVYAYKGGKVAPYGAGGSGSGAGSGSGSSGVIFDDYGRPIGLGSGMKNGSGNSGKVVKAIPKSDAQEDVHSGVQKFRVKLLSESVGQSDLDVLCQIGLDGIRILDVATSRTLRIYQLETVTRCEVLDSYIFAFWAKSSIDFEPRRIRLKSNSYTTNNILDTVTAATFQIKEMGGRNNPSDIPKVSDQPSEKKKGFGDWVNLMKPSNEEKDHWMPDEAVAKCTSCGTDFGAFMRRHHCRNCGDIFCDKCTQGRIAITADEHAVPVRVCDRCMAEVTQRLTNAKETGGKVAAFTSHEDLAKKLKEEMEKNRKTLTGSASNGSGTRMKEVACPTCTVHLQVQVPASGSETIECSVCQHPFLVNAH